MSTTRNAVMASAVGLVVCGFCLAQDTPKQARGQDAAKAGNVGTSQDESAVRAAAERFAEAFNRGDAAALGELFVEDARVVDQDGQPLEGRTAIVERFQEGFRARPGLKVKFTTESVRFLTPDVAVEEGRAEQQASEGEAANGPLAVHQYTVLYVKRDGRWRIDSVRDHAEASEGDPSPRAHLEELAWMVGDWIDEGDDGAVVRTNCAWSDDGNYLLRTYRVEFIGKPVRTGTQRVGWDPQRRQIRSWAFDSDGGFAEGYWTRAGENRWVIKSIGTLPDGSTATATNVITRDHPDTMRWQSIDRTLGGEALPDAEEILIARRPPGPADSAGAGSAPAKEK